MSLFHCLKIYDRKGSDCIGKISRLYRHKVGIGAVVLVYVWSIIISAGSPENIETEEMSENVVAESIISESIEPEIFEISETVTSTVTQTVVTSYETVTVTENVNVTESVTLAENVNVSKDVTISENSEDSENIIVAATTPLDEFDGESFEATYYYPGNGLGTSGYSGRELINGYSVASNLFPMGTIIEVKGAGLDGIYRVDDKGATLFNKKTNRPVLDVFYDSPQDIPPEFANLGRVELEVKIIQPVSPV